MKIVVIEMELLLTHFIPRCVTYIDIHQIYMTYTDRHHQTAKHNNKRPEIKAKH